MMTSCCLCSLGWLQWNAAEMVPQIRMSHGCTLKVIVGGENLMSLWKKQIESRMRERKITLPCVVRSSSLSLQVVSFDEMNYSRWHSTRFHTHWSGLHLAEYCILHFIGESRRSITLSFIHQKKENTTQRH